LEHCLERTLPTLAKGGNPQRALQLLAGMSRQIQEAISVGHRHPFWTIGDFYNVIALPNFSFLQHAKIESWSVMRDEKRWHPGIVHADGDAVAGYARLRYFKFSTTNAVAIANADLVIGKSLNGEVFSELSIDEVFPSEKVFPVVIGVHLINENGALLATMTGEIALPIASNIRPAHHSSSNHRRFPDSGMDGFAVPCHVAWKADIY
jgi:hypothetical protein